MDKILRRVRMAERQVARRNKRMQEVFHGIEKRTALIEVSQQRKQAGHDLGAAVKARHEDLELGPLAPRRDVSKLDPAGNHWGSISLERATLQVKVTDKQRDARAAWAGGARYLCLAPGDRVVLTEGPYKGQISTIATIKRDIMAVELDGNVGIVNVMVPEWIRGEDVRAVQQYKSAVPISSIRLVHPLTDPATGTTRDVIIRELKPVGISHDRPTRRVRFARIVPGLNVRIPWPRVEPTAREDHVVDTLRLEVEERTFVPTLLRPPMPESVVDELRNRYSKFRTRHTPEYVARVEAEEADKRARRKGTAAGMLLPVQEYNRRMRELRRQRGQPELTDEMLEKIGEVVARNRLGRSAAAGAAPAAPPVPESADAEVSAVQEAVEQLSLGGDSQGTTTGEDQPRTS